MLRSPARAHAMPACAPAPEQKGRIRLAAARAQRHSSTPSLDVRLSRTGSRTALRALAATGAVDAKGDCLALRRALFASLNLDCAEFTNALMAKTGMGPNARHEDGTPVRSFAATYDTEATLRVLLAVPGIDVNAIGRDENTALAVAASHGQEAIALALLGMQGLYINAGNEQGNTAPRPSNGIQRLLAESGTFFPCCLTQFNAIAACAVSPAPPRI